MKSDQLSLVALVGRPNVGKSSLFNRLARKRDAIVDDTPGVTRDRHYARVSWLERSFILIDTGGIEALDSPETGAKGAFPKEANADSRGEVIGGIQEQTWMAVDEADIVLFMVDGRDGLSGEDIRVAQALRRTGKSFYIVVNKVDGPELESRLLPPFYELGAEKLWPISSAHGYGINTLMEDMLEHLGGAEGSGDLHEDTMAIAFIGRPNVGKSSLVNRLLGEKRMVVSTVPGTTRDTVDTLLERDNQHYLLIDTAGIRRRGKVTEKLEKFSVIQALSGLERCDVAFFLVDAEEGVTEQDTKIIGYAMDRGRACMVLINKWDLVKDDKKRQKFILEELDRATNFIGYAPVLSVSALSGFGVNKLFPMVNGIMAQFGMKFTTNRLNRILQKAVDGHTPGLYRGHRLKFYYATQVSTHPPTLVIFVNYPKGVHFSYYRYLVNSFRNELGLDKSPMKLILKERQRKKYG
ncbi:MAG: ribosome biogenesis GTPase Der [Proteobacteria bacterium]|nr:ribosome biogenesis GTPase Der [Pseudomonadota bacterium]MBU1688874.1 ribosome biogenesis GTPase Der [Pseudomonadota bacterium]